MQETRTGQNSLVQSRNSRTILLPSVAVSIILILGKTFDVYRFVFVGAVFEALWFPVIAAGCVLIMLSLFYWVKDKFSYRSLYLYALLVLLVAILFTVFRE